MIVEQTRELFRIELRDDGSYFAVRGANPMFCFSGPTISAAVGKAERALDWNARRKMGDTPSGFIGDGGSGV